ncbi:MAG: molybdopterin cofactor-binding domain-containing protein, partial [Bilophila sp.]
IVRGEPVDAVLARCAHTVEATYTTQAVEHAFLETEACLALPEADGVRLYVQSQGIWHDKADIAALLNIPPSQVIVTLADAGGAFGGKEDFTCQPHAALAAFLLQRPVNVRLSRPESLRMHPKRHGMRLHYRLGCDENGLLQAAKIRILADTGAYASAGGPVVTRTGTHATSAYHIPSVDVHVKAVYTNNLPAGAFRGFGVNQSNFAMECLLDALCEQGGFDRWQFRYDNALAPGKMVTTGQVLGQGTALKQTLLAVRDAFRSHPRAGIACAIKNAGIGNGIPEPCDCILEVHPVPEAPAKARLVLHHGWTEMGQGINTVARQLVCEVARLAPDVGIELTASTEYGAFAGSTTASRGTFQLGHAVVSAARQLREDLDTGADAADATDAAALVPLIGRLYKGHYDSVGQTSGEGEPGTIRN